ncbi:MAG: H+transporting two-sector ATPase subunit, partial [Bacillota bacterium]|nr:H+transporting two-sector ATPase subunit [Bacillota bacterium]
MVTIEQKLLLFSKLLNQSMDKNFNEELKKLNQHYEALLKKNKESVDNEVFEIEEKAKKQVEMKLIEQKSKTKVLLKKEIMNVKEKYFKIFMENFKNRLRNYTLTDDYKTYLSKSIKNLNEELSHFNKEFNSVNICLNSKDYNKYSIFIKEEFQKEIYDKIINFKTMEFLGGIILE